MELVFRDTILCPDITIARKLAFDRSVSCRCISLEGDVADPAGTMEGGSVNNNRKTPLERFMSCKEARQKLKEVSKQYEMAYRRQKNGTGKRKASY